jgi:hypothetical protein
MPEKLLVFLALLLFTASAQAHPVGRVCVYTDVDGYRATDYCHHLRAEQPADVYIGLPGLRFGFGRNEGWRSGNYHHGWDGGGERRWRDGQTRPYPQPAPGIQFNFGTGGGHGGQGRHGQRP